MSVDMPAPLITAKVKIATGSSLRAISIKMGYSPNWLRMALSRPYPKAENVIANIIGIPPQKIWASRFNSDGSRKDKRKLRKKKTDNNVTAQG